MTTHILSRLEQCSIKQTAVATGLLGVATLLFMMIAPLVGAAIIVLTALFALAMMLELYTEMEAVPE